MVLAAAEPGGLMHAPDTYLRKLVVGPQVAGHVSINDPAATIIGTIAERLGRAPFDITVVILDRPRHEALIDEDQCRDVAGHHVGGVLAITSA